MKKIIFLLAIIFAPTALWADAASDLQPGDTVKLVNPEFSQGTSGWNRPNGNYSIWGNNTLGDTIAYWNGSNPYRIEQTLTDLPNGLYLVQMNGYDQCLRDYDKIEAWLEEGNKPETYLFANDREVRLKTVFDDALTGPNIYRWYKGVSTYDNYFTNEAATCYMPKWEGTSVTIALSHHPHIYLNSIVGVVTDGTLTIGWQKTDSGREAPVFFDHFRVTYLSADASKLQQYVDDNKPLTGEALNQLLAQYYEQQRQAVPLLELAIEQPGTLGDEIFAALGNDFNLSDLKRLRIRGQLNEADLVTLRDRCTGLVELDMSKVLNTSFINEQFQNHYDLRYVTLPDYLESLPVNAFSQCYYLNSITLPATLKEIGSNAFYRTYNLKSALLPESIIKMGDGAYNESGLQQLILPSTLKTIPRNAFRNNYELTDLQMNGQTEIATSNAFDRCTHLKVLRLPQSMQHIGEYAFSSCSRLSDVQLNEGLIDIGRIAFASCNALRRITLPSSVQGLYSGPFYGCDSLLEVVCLAVAPPFTNNTKNPFGDSRVARTISVPYISQNVYKQTKGWDQHNIIAHSELPKSVYMNQPYNMTWPQDLMTSWKPNIYITTNAKNTYSEGGNGGMLSYGSLYVGSKAAFSADTLGLYYSFYSAREVDNRKFFTPLLINGTGRADVVVTEMNVAQDYWTFFSVPYDVKVSDITSTHPDDPFVIRAYSGQKRAEGKNTEAWVNMTGDSILHARHGYIIRTTNGVWEQQYNNFFLPSVNNGAKTRFFTNDDVVVPLENHPTEFAHNRSWNFIGNPYPCFFDIRAMQTTSPITIWNRRSQYETYSPLDDDYILNPGQGFFIQRPLDQGEVVFLKEGRQLDLAIRDTIYYSNARARAVAQPRQVYNLCLASVEQGFAREGAESREEQSITVADRTRVVINEAATLGYDVSFDASKFFSSEPGTAHLYTLDDNVQYAINERPLANGEVQLGLQVPSSGSYTISLDNRRNGISGGEITLIDCEASIETQLLPSPREGAGVGSYTFQAEAGTHNARFRLRLAGTAVTSVQSVAVLQQQTEQLFDLQGRPVSHPTKGLYIMNGKKVIVK